MLKPPDQVETGNSPELNIPPHFAENLVAAVNKLGAMVAELGYGPDYSEDTRPSPNQDGMGTIWKAFSPSRLAGQARVENDGTQNRLWVEIKTTRSETSLTFSVGNDVESPCFILYNTRYKGVWFRGLPDCEGRGHHYLPEYKPEQGFLKISNTDMPHVSGKVILATDGTGRYYVEGGDPQDTSYGVLLATMESDITAINQLATTLNNNSWKLVEDN